jgi:hypothetical protein
MNLTMKPETIEVFCVITPDGHLTYTWNIDGARQVMRDWSAGLTTEQKAVHERANTMGGVVLARILKSDFDQIPMTSWRARDPRL